MANLRALIYGITHKRKIIKEYKPKLIFWYITFDGNQEKIKDAMASDYGIENKENYNKIMKNINIEDYVMITEKDFYKHSSDPKDLIVERKKNEKN